jgi:uncharacterized protein
MRRKDREITDRQQMDTIISNCHVCHLALASPEGSPYAIALNFGYAPGNPPALYFHCATAGKKLEFIRQNPRCAFILDRPIELVTGPMACDWGMNYESVMGAGLIEILTDAVQRRAGLDRIMAQYGHRSPVYSPDAMEKTLVLKLTIGEMTAKRRV